MLTSEESELKAFLELVFEHSQSLIEQARTLIKKLELYSYLEPTWEELYDQKLLHQCQFDIGSVLDDIATVLTRLNYLRGEYKTSKLDYPDVHFPHKYKWQETIEKQLDVLKDFEKSLSQLNGIWERRKTRLNNVIFMQNNEFKHRAM